MIAIAIILLYIVWKWDNIMDLMALTALINKRQFTDKWIGPRFIILVIAAVLLQFALK